MTTTTNLSPQPDEQEVADFGAIVATLRPRTYTPAGDMAERIVRRLLSSLGEDASSDAVHVMGLLQFATVDEKPTINFWADELTAPYLGLVEQTPYGGARLWRIRPAAAGVVYVGSQWHYWPNPHLDPDIPNMPIVLGVDDWCLSF